MSLLARIVASIEGPPSEGLKVEQKSFEKFSRPFYTTRATPLGVAAYRVSPSKEEAIWFFSVNGAAAGCQTQRTKTSC